MNTHELVVGALAERTATRPGDWFLVSKARHGMEVVFTAAATMRGPGHVLTQPFTCITAVNPILAAGLTPTWGETSPANLSLDLAALPDVVHRATRAAVIQHTFGAVADVAAARAALPAQVLVVEDAAHALGALSQVADVSIASFGAEKLLPTRAGGAVWVNPELEPELRGEITARLTGLPEPGMRARLAQRATRPVRRVTGRLGAPGRGVNNALAALRLIDPPIHPAEARGVNVGRPERLGGPALGAVLVGLAGLDANTAHRQRIANRYREALAGGLGSAGGGSAVTIPAAYAHTQVPLVRFPVLLENAAAAAAAFSRLEAAGCVPGRWYRPTLFPGPVDPQVYGYDPEAFPVAEELSARILNLPTAPFVTDAMADRVISVLLG